MDILDKVKSTPHSDWPVATQEISGPARFFGLYGGEHIAATEFVIGATLVQYGCSATDIVVGLAIGNLLATLSFALLCAPIAVDTRLSLYTYLQKVVGVNVQKLYNLVFGLGFAALGATGICVSATAIRRVFDIPVQLEWYPTSQGFVIVVLALGAVVVSVAANGFKGVSRFATKCVPWMIMIFALAYIVVLPMLADSVGYGKIHSLSDAFNILDQYCWRQTPEAQSKGMGIWHVIAFAWTINVALHIGLNDMAVLRYAKKKSYGYISAMGMFVGHYFAWIGAGILGAAASTVLNKDLGLLDSGEVTFAVLGYAGLLGVVIAGWTTANPTIYRVTLSFNNLFPRFSYKQMCAIAGTVIVIAACFPCVQAADSVLTYLGLVVEGIGAIVIAEHLVFPHIGYTRYWSMYKGDKTNVPALISWMLSFVFFALMLVYRPIHQNFWFIPNFFIPFFSYIILAGLMGAHRKYDTKQQEELEYEKALQEYVDKHTVLAERLRSTMPMTVAKVFQYVALGAMAVTGIVYAEGCVTVEQMKGYELAFTVVYFICIITSSLLENVERKKLQQ